MTKLKVTHCFAAALLVFLLFTISCDESRKVGRYDGLLTGLENLPFNTALSMYSKIPAIPYDDTAATTIETIDKSLNKNVYLHDQKTLDLFSKLTPYRETLEVQEAISRWAKIQGLRFRKDYVEIHKELEGDEPSRLKQLAEEMEIRFPNLDTINQCWMALEAFPYNVDARNNLAVFYMNSPQEVNIDPLTVLIQLELETIREISGGDSYPAAINLTTILEINGQPEKAEELANSSLLKWADIPQVRYNAAWYKVKAGDYAKAEELLKPLADTFPDEDDDDADAQENIYQELYEIVSALTHSEKPIWEVGVDGKYSEEWGGFDIFDLKFTWSQILFIVLSIILGGIYMRLIEESDLGTWLGVIVMLAVWIGWWGFPEGWNWIWFLLYPFISMFLGTMTMSETYEG